MTPDRAYDKLRAKSLEIAYLGSAAGLLHWDQRTGIPSKGHSHRSAQLAALAGIIHRMATDPEIGDLLALVEGTDTVRDPLSVEAVNVRELRRSYDKITRIPEALAVEIARTCATAQAVWESARPRNDWDGFKPHLKRIVDLKREEAHALGFANEPYDALLDNFEQGLTAREIEPVFKRLAAVLAELTQRILGSETRVPSLPSDARFPVADQKEFALSCAETLGLDLQAGRLDVSAHPFTSGIGPGDVRITSRYDEHYFEEGFFAVIHEAGHAMYHQGLPAEHWGTPFGRPASLGINESQSRMWENMVARSPKFWEHFFPIAMKRFPCLGTMSADDFVFSVNRVQPGLIRVQADEVTYNLHVLVRFEIETALTRGDLDVDDLPVAWNDKYRSYLGVTPPDYASGVMQDVHWSGGAIGYFPTYTLGNLFAAQFFARIKRDIGDVEEQFSRGDFRPLLDWLREKIHAQGCRYLPRDLMRNVTGEDLDPCHLTDYLERKYGALYGL